jgi:electron-transferring-flavoprotein dehydrogenase
VSAPENVPEALPAEAPPRQSMDVDIVCVGFGPATAGFLNALAPKIAGPDGAVLLESRAAPGMPLQVICYERADDPGFGVSGVATRARGIRASIPDLDPSAIPLACTIEKESLVYLLDPVGASRRSAVVRAAERSIRALRRILPYEEHGLRLPWIPPFLRKDGGLVLSIGQFTQWAAARVLGTGAVQVWPGTPAASPLVEDGRVAGVRLIDQGVDKKGSPDAGYLPGMDIRAGLTVVGDGPVGPIGREIDRRLGAPPGRDRGEWAVGMKMVVDLPEGSPLQAGTVIHTLGYPEPGIFGFLYVGTGRTASLGIFVPSWLESPVRTAYRYLQHWMLHPYLWRWLEGGALRSWGAKSLDESGRRGEPHLAGEGWARIGEGSGSTNVLTGSGVDEAWTTGVQLAEAVAAVLAGGKPFTKENLEATYVRRRRESWVEAEGRVAARARDGFRRGFVPGVLGMALAGFTRGKLAVPRGRGGKGIPSAEEYFRGRIPSEEIARIRKECAEKRVPLHDALMERAGWPPIPFDGKLLVSHQDALLLGGKVQAPAGYADHVVFLYPALCESCGTKLCIEVCSGQAIAPGEGGVPAFDRDKCVHCGACLWSCPKEVPGEPGRSSIDFRAGTGGLHSAEN